MNAPPRRSGARHVPVLAAVAGVLVMSLATVGAQGILGFVLPPLIVGGALAVTVWTVRRARLDRLAYETRLTAWAASEAVLAERLTIARDLHDIVSHGLGLITVRAAATRHLTKPPDVADALTDIEDASRQATNELRRMLTVLREPSATARRAPVDTLDDLPAIVQAASRAGLETQLSVEPLGAVPAGVQLAVCQTVRETLSNSARYAGPTQVRVDVRREAGDIVTTVVDTGPAPGGWHASPGAGHGLAGLRERVGNLTAERDGAGFRVVARIPENTS